VERITRGGKKKKGETNPSVKVGVKKGKCECSKSRLCTGKKGGGKNIVAPIGERKRFDQLGTR